MALREIFQIPATVLRQKALALESVDDGTRALIADMFETMYAAPGIGLAAPQIGISRRVIVLDPARQDEPNQPIAMINPEIVRFGEAVRVHEEGCLSIPDVYAEVERPASLTVRFIDEHGTLRERDYEGLAATIIQHEIDHLNGVLFVDHLSRLRRELLIKKFYKARRDNEATA